MKRFLLRIWRIMPPWLQGLASAIMREHFQVAAAAIIFNEQGQLLLCEHTYRGEHPWGLPGGGIHFGEDPAQAVRRELREETGFVAHETKLLLTEGSKEAHRVVISYLCSGVSGEFIPNEEVSAIRYFDPEALPVLPDEERATIEKVLAIVDKRVA